MIAVPFWLGMPRLELLGQMPAADEVLMPALPDAAPQQRLAVLYRHLAERVATSARMPMVLAGDCLAALGVAAGLQRRGVDPVLVWLDAHGDFHTWETSRSGFLGGMPLAMMVGRGEQSIVEALGLLPLQEERVVLVDGREHDRGEDLALAGSRLAHLPVTDWRTRDLPSGPLYVHVDVDVVDPAEMPALEYPAPGGPMLQEVRAELGGLVATGRVAAISVACTWKPADPAAEQAAAATGVLLQAMG